MLRGRAGKVEAKVAVAVSGEAEPWRIAYPYVAVMERGVGREGRAMPPLQIHIPFPSRRSWRGGLAGCNEGSFGDCLRAHCDAGTRLACCASRSGPSRGLRPGVRACGSVSAFSLAVAIFSLLSLFFCFLCFSEAV